MAITDKKTGVWGLDQVYNKENQGSIWTYSGASELWGWGRNHYGQLGQNNVTNRSSPVQIGSETTWAALPRCGSYPGYFSAATKTDGTLWMWGENGKGQLGQNSETAYSSPVQVGSDTDWSQDPTQISVGRCTQAIKTDGTLWSWGYNWQGQAGTNVALNNISSPTQVAGSWSKTAQARTTPLAIKTDGTLWAWGGNQFGTQGVNDRTSRSSPIQIPGSTWSDVSGGLNSVIATKTDGTLWMWGDNQEGDGLLGQNNQTSYSSPVQIPGTTWDTGDLKIATNKYASGAIKTDGTLWVWGYRHLGVSGEPSNYARSSPIQIPGTTWNKLTVYEESGFFALKTDGTLWGWGAGGNGALAQNNTTGYSSPKQIPGDWKQVTGFGAYGYAIKNK